MIHVVTAHNRHLYEDAIAEMHRMRKDYFIDQRGWSGLTERAGGEYDQYDDDKMIYLLALGSDGHIDSSLRMRPAETGSVIGDIFPQLIADDEPSVYRPDVWEISRYFAAPRARGRSGIKPQAEVRLAALEVALAHGAKRLVGMIDVEVLPAALASSGWRVRPLGLPAPYPEGVAQGIEVQVSRGAIVDFEEMFALEGPVALELDPARAPVRLPPQEIETLLQVGQASPDRSRFIVSVVKRIVEMQDEVDEEELLGIVSYVEKIAAGEDLLRPN